VARVPDRRRAHKSVPSPARSQLRRTSSRISCRQTGAKPRFLWAIDDLQRGGRAADARASIWRISPAGKSLSGTPCSTAFGAVATVFFREVAFSGYDVYGAKFARGLEFRVRLAPDGKINIMPGQSTRFLTIRTDPHNGRAALQRISPVPGSEQALRRHIDARRRGEPNYDDMTR
jgi:hypothetical protein